MLYQLVPTTIGLTNQIRKALDRNKQLQEAIASQHAAIARAQRVADENSRELRDSLEGAHRFLHAVASPTALSTSWSHAMAGLASYVDPRAEIPANDGPARVYPGQFIVLAFDYYAHIGADIGTILCNIVASPTEAHPDEVSFMMQHWPAISVRGARPRSLLRSR